MLITSGVARAACPVCGLQHAACGPPTTTTPVDERHYREVTNVGERRKYRVTVNGNETVLNLTDEDAKLYPDAEPVEAAPKTTTTTSAKRRTPADKAHTAENK